MGLPVGLAARAAASPSDCDGGGGRDGRAGACVRVSRLSVLRGRGLGGMEGGGPVSFFVPLSGSSARPRCVETEGDDRQGEGEREAPSCEVFT
jgi:hypothetical protein